MSDLSFTPDSGSYSLVNATLGLASQLETNEILQSFIRQACELTQARFGILETVDAWDKPTSVLHHGFSAAQLNVLQQVCELGASGYQQLMRLVPESGELLVNEVSASSYTCGTEEFKLQNFFAATIQVHTNVFVRLFLANKYPGFTDSDSHLVQLLSQAAGVAMENARLYREAQNRERWIRASQEITSALLDGADEEESLNLIARTVLEVAKADTALIILPSIGYNWACEIAEGYLAEQLIGVVFPAEGRAMAVLSEGVGMIVDSLNRASTMRIPELRDFGPALYAPMMNRDSGIGVLLLLRKPGSPEFESADLPLAESLASQAAFVLEVASARHLEDVAALYDERDRIGRDLHDFAIQQLFATGMHLDSARKKVTAGEITTEEIIQVFTDSIANLDEAVGQIRGIVRSLRDKDLDTELLERIQRETSVARNSLGYAPGLIIKIDGEAVASEDEERLREVNHRIGNDLGDDVVAVIREGLSNVARHAKATAVKVILRIAGQAPEGQVTIRVIDNGVGIPLERTRTSGIGNIRARARRHGGDSTVKPREDSSGTILEWWAPIFDE